MISCAKERAYMETSIDERRLSADTVSWEMIKFVQDNQERLGLEEAQLFYDFPILKDSDDKVIIAKILLLSPVHGLLVLQTLDTSIDANAKDELENADEELEHVFSLLYSRLIRSRQLRKSRTDLIVPTNTIIFAPNLGKKTIEIRLEAKLALSTDQLVDILERCRVERIASQDYQELVATIEGAKGIVRPRPRDISKLGPHSRGALASKIESEITSFDRRQKHGAMTVLDGFQRIRGLAGSGKTVVLAMKAALIHLRDPEARIVYTFYTKGLYQHIQRLITRFYRQFEDSDPDWTRLKILHGWGGVSGDGVYYSACVANGVSPITLKQAKVERVKDPFDYACKKLLAAGTVHPIYDYVLIDEGQDFPASFIQLCTRLAENNRVVFGYDDLQTIFQATTPELKDIVGTDKSGKPLVSLTEDVVLYKCYRNPREILVCAHALGFGIYSKIVQMLENKEQWEDIGYKVLEGGFVEGSNTVIERPEANSLATISLNQRPEDIVKVTVFESFEDEMNGLVASIVDDLKDGLRPDDILVIVVDDRNAKAYLATVVAMLAAKGISCNNMHDDTYGIRDFYKESQVTLSTVHKAKGNEAFMVYVLGVDALYSSYAAIRERNMLFTAMTRAKGWVRVSGVGEPAILCKNEIEIALENFPCLKFTYPNPEELKIIKRDLEEKASRKQKAERKLDEVLDEMTKEEIIRFLDQRSIKKKK
jgi:superfamily I DNA and RNA helicase